MAQAKQYARPYEPEGYYCPICETDWTTPADDGTCWNCHDVYIGGWFYRIRNVSLLKVIGLATVCYWLYRLLRLFL